MKKALSLVAFAAISIALSAQTSPLEKSPQTLAQEMVQNVATDVTLTAEQEAELTIAATKYAEAVVAANSEYTTDDNSLVEVKASAWKEYNMQMRNILTDEQYAIMQVKQQTRREEVNNKIRGGQQQ